MNTLELPTVCVETQEMIGDKILLEQDGCKYCLGCVVCEESLERETDI